MSIGTLVGELNLCAVEKATSASVAVTFMMSCVVVYQERSVQVFEGQKEEKDV
jgi:hypothetical protein